MARRKKGARYNINQVVVLDLYNMREDTQCALIIERILVAYFHTIRVQLIGREDPCWIRTTGNGDNMIIYKGRVYSDYSIEPLPKFIDTYPDRVYEEFDYNETQEGQDDAAEEKNTERGAVNTAPKMQHIGNPVTDYNPFNDAIFAGGTAIPPNAYGPAEGHPAENAGTGGYGNPEGTHTARMDPAGGTLIRNMELADQEAIHAWREDAEDVMAEKMIDEQYPPE